MTQWFLLHFCYLSIKQHAKQFPFAKRFSHHSKAHDCLVKPFNIPRTATTKAKNKKKCKVCIIFLHAWWTRFLPLHILPIKKCSKTREVKRCLGGRRLLESADSVPSAQPAALNWGWARWKMGLENVLEPVARAKDPLFSRLGWRWASLWHGMILPPHFDSLNVLQSWQCERDRPNGASYGMCTVHL